MREPINVSGMVLSRLPGRRVWQARRDPDPGARQNHRLRARRRRMKARWWPSPIRSSSASFRSTKAATATPSPAQTLKNTSSTWRRCSPAFITAFIFWNWPNISARKETRWNPDAEPSVRDDERHPPRKTGPPPDPVHLRTADDHNQRRSTADVLLHGVRHERESDRFLPARQRHLRKLWKNHRDPWALQPGTVLACRYTLRHPLAKLYGFTVNEEILDKLERLLRAYLHRYVEKKMKTLQILDVMK